MKSGSLTSAEAGGETFGRPVLDIASSLSLAVFIIRTELSPSAVIAAWASPRNVPNLLHDRYPCPPHLSLHTDTVSSSSQLASGLIAQHMVTTCWCSDPSAAWKAHLSFT